MILKLLKEELMNIKDNQLDNVRDILNLISDRNML